MGSSQLTEVGPSLCRAVQLNVRSETIYRQLDWKSPALGRVRVQRTPEWEQAPFRREFCRTTPACPQAGAVSLVAAPSRQGVRQQQAKIYRDGPVESYPVILCWFFSAARPSLMLARSSGYAPLHRVWV